MSKIRYKDGYLYQLVEGYSIDTGIKPPEDVTDVFFTLRACGLLVVEPFYAWDGPSGPAIDTKNFMRGSLVHDCFYQMIRHGYLPEVPYRKLADELLFKMCREDGMSWVRSKWVYHSLRMFGHHAATPQGDRKVLEAP